MAGGGRIRGALNRAQIEKFTKLGDDQRGAPEKAMLHASQYMGGGVLPVLIEHIGDLTHRMSHGAKYDTAYTDLVQPKVAKGIDYLESPYGFVREMEENFEANAKYNDIPLEEFRQEVDMRLQKYADEHKKLKVHNRPQYFGREAAVSMGEQRWDDALMNLKKLQAILDTGEFEPEALKMVHEEGFAGGGRVKSLLKKVQAQIPAGTQEYYAQSRPKRKIEVLVNPNQKEVERWAGREIKELRMMFDKEGNTYVWDGTEAIHFPVIQSLGLKFEDIADSMSDTPVHPKNYSSWVFDHADDVATYNHLNDYAPPKVTVDETDVTFDEDVLSDSSGREFAGGGKVKGALDKLKKLTRRDVLKGIGAAGVTAAAAGKAGLKKTELPPAAALKQIDEALSVPIRDLTRPYAKNVFTKKEWDLLSEWIDEFRMQLGPEQQNPRRLLDPIDPEMGESKTQYEHYTDLLRKADDEVLTGREQRLLNDLIDEVAENSAELPMKDAEGLGRIFKEQDDIFDNLQREIYTDPEAIEPWRKAALKEHPNADPEVMDAFEEILGDGRLWDDRYEYGVDDFANYFEGDTQKAQELYDMIHSDVKAFAGGGKIRKFNRRDVLKGLGAAGATGLAGVKAGTKGGALDVPASGAALKEIESALEGALPAAWSKQDMTPRQWNTIDKYLLDKADDLVEELRNYDDPMLPEATQQNLQDIADLEHEIKQIEHIRGAEPDYVFDPSAQDYLEEFVQDTVNDLGIEIHDYGDWDDINDPKVTHVREMERLLSPNREYGGDMTIQENLIEDLGDPGDDFAGGGAVKKALTSLKEGPGAYEAAMSAAKAGDVESALEYLRQLQELLQLSDKDFSAMMGQGSARYGMRLKPGLLDEADLDTPVGGYKDKRAPDSPMRKAGGGPIKGSLIKANEWFARRAGKRLNEGMDIPEGYDSFYTRKNPKGSTSIIGVRPDGTEHTVSTIAGLYPGDETESFAKEIAGAYNTGGFSDKPINPVALDEIFGGPDDALKAEVTQLQNDNDLLDMLNSGELPLGDDPNTLRSIKDILDEALSQGDDISGDMGELDLSRIMKLLDEQDFESGKKSLGDADPDEYDAISGFWREYSEQPGVDLEIYADPNRHGLFGFRDPAVHGDLREHGGGLEGSIIDMNSDNPLDTIEEVEFNEWPPKPRFAEGGEVKREPNKALQYLRAVGRSLAGAIPGTSENFHQLGEDIGYQMYRKGALPVAGFKSQWWGIDPDTGEFVYAGPLSGDSSPGTDAIPGIIDETMLLPSLPQMIEEVYDYKTGKFEDPGYQGPDFPAPQFSLDAAERANVNWDESLRSMGLDPEAEGPRGFVENTLMSGGMMLGQLPVPTSWFGRARNLLPATKSQKVDRVLRQLAEEGGEKASLVSRIAGAGPEFLFPTIDPKTSNYIAGSLFGGTLMTALDPGEIEEVEQTMDPQIAALLDQFHNGTPEEVEEAREILRAILEANTPEEAEGFAGGGKIRKFNRRDILKGLGATAATAVAAGKAGTKVADEAVPGLRQIEEALEAAPVAAKKAAPRVQGTPWRKVAEAIDQEFKKYYPDADPDNMKEMYDSDAADYRYIADAMDDGRPEDAIRRYDSMDTASREMIYDVDTDTNIALRRQLGKAGSDWERLEWDDLDPGEQELILDELQTAYEEGGIDSYNRAGSRIIDDYGVDADGEDLAEFFEFLDDE